VTGEEYGLTQALRCIGFAYERLGQDAKALAYYERALIVCRQNEADELEEYVLQDIGMVLFEMGQHEQALGYYQQSLAVGHETDSMWVWATLRSIGDVYSAMGQHRQALEYYEQSLAVSREIGWGVDRDVLSSIGDAHQVMGQYEEALEPYAQAFELAHASAMQVPWEEDRRSDPVADLAVAASRLAGVQFELGLLEGAFNTIQSAKGVPLLQLLGQAQAQVDDPAVQEALNSYRDAQAAMQKYRDDQYRLDDDDEEQRAYINARLEEYQAQANDAWDYIREHAPRLTEIIEVRGLSAEQVQAEILQPGQVVLEYLVTDEEIILFCLPWEGELTAVRMALPEPEAGGGWRVTPNSEPEDEDRSFDDWIEGQLVDLYGHPMSDSRQAGRALYELLVEPVADSIPAGAELIICPDRSLFLVPFEALVGPEEEYLLERHALSYSTSATMLGYIRPGGDVTGALVVAVSFGGGETTSTRGAHDPLPGGQYTHSDFAPLAAVVPEARAVAALLGTALLLLESQATEMAVRENMPGKRVIHLATHSFLSEVPLLSGIVLYQEEEQDADAPDRAAGLSGSDGFLRMSEVMGIRLDGCELVVLSCSHSALGEIRPGAGTMGLTQGFLVAGARSVLASLRGVHDDETRALMERFYRNWRQEGMSKREALRQAKLWLLDEKGVGAAEWAPFVLYGLE